MRRSTYILTALIGLLAACNSAESNTKTNSVANKIPIEQTCFCDKDTILKEIISCDTISFDNKSKLYWNFNCDSSWLTFESSIHNKEVIFSLRDGLQNLTGRLGYIYAQEYKQTFLIQNSVISGCCDPPEFILFDKFTGKKKENLGSILFYSEDKNLPFVISLTYSGYDSTINKKFDGNSLTIYNIDSQKKYYINLPKGEIDNACKRNNEMFPEHLFNEPIFKGTSLTLTYSLNRNKDLINGTKAVTIDLKKYNH